MNGQNLFKKIKLYESIIIDEFSNRIEENLIYSIFNLVDQDSKYLFEKFLKNIKAKINGKKKRY